MTAEEINGMQTIIITILLGVMAGCLLPSFTLWCKSMKDFIRERKRMYNSYLQRLDDFEQYHSFMEKCEFDYQVKWLLDIQEQAEQQLKSLFK